MEIFDLSMMQKGGPAMWPLALLGFIGLVIFLERALYLHKGQIRSADFLAGIKNVLRNRRFLEALTVCEDTPGPVPCVVKAALMQHERGRERMLEAVRSASLVEIPELERRIGSLAAIARVAPLLGLLGTVLGMLKAFGSLQAAGAYAHLGVLAAGLAEALISTAAGLSIAIMAHLAYHFLQGRVRALVHDMEFAAHEIMQFLLHELPPEAQKKEAKAE